MTIVNLLVLGLNAISSDAPDDLISGWFVDASFILWVFPEGGNDQGIAYYNEK